MLLLARERLWLTYKIKDFWSLWRSCRFWSERPMTLSIGVNDYLSRLTVRQEPGGTHAYVFCKKSLLRCTNPYSYILYMIITHTILLIDQSGGVSPTLIYRREKQFQLKHLGSSHCSLFLNSLSSEMLFESVINQTLRRKHFRRSLCLLVFASLLCKVSWEIWRAALLSHSILLPAIVCWHAYTPAQL